MKKRCEECSYCIPLGRGDHICDESPTMELVLDDYVPTENYGWCNKSTGKKK